MISVLYHMRNFAIAEVTDIVEQITNNLVEPVTHIDAFSASITSEYLICSIYGYIRISLISSYSSINVTQKCPDAMKSILKDALVSIRIRYFYQIVSVCEVHF